MLMDLLGVAGLGVLGYLTYEVCRTDRKMCGLGVVGFLLVAVAYVGRYVNIDKTAAVVAVLLAVVFVLLWINR